MLETSIISGTLSTHTTNGHFTSRINNRLTRSRISLLNFILSDVIVISFANFHSLIINTHLSFYSDEKYSLFVR